MATLRMTKPNKDPRTGVWLLRKRMPARYAAVAAQAGGIVKITTGTKDNREALRVWPDVLRRYAEMEAEWERLVSVVVLSPEDAALVAAKWAAWIAADLGRLEGDPADAVFLDNSMSVESKLVLGMADLMGDREARQACAGALLEARADDAAKLAGITVAPGSHGMLTEAMRPAVVAAYRQAGLRDTGATGQGARWNPLQAARAALPSVPDAAAPALPGTSLMALFEAWKAVSVAKSRTIGGSTLRHRSPRGVPWPRRQRQHLAGGYPALAGRHQGTALVNNTWNNRLSAVRQVFAQAVADGRLNENPADNSLRLKKSKAATRLPYSDDDAARVLLAARKEVTPALRWAHWIMAFSGMRVAEALQLTRLDVRQEGDIWCLAIHEDDPSKSVKTGQRRNVPVHPALIKEGLIAYVQTLPGDGPLFPDKALGPHGTRGERGWNAVGKWVRTTVGIIDPQKAPNHSWRHRVEDELRAAEVPEDVRDAIVGHARKTTGRSYGVRGEALVRLHRELSKLPVPPGVVFGPR